jgi:hypothetical protein
MFEIIYGGAAGAMQAFGDRMDQDEILRLMAFTETLRQPVNRAGKFGGKLATNLSSSTSSAWRRASSARRRRI